VKLALLACAAPLCLAQVVVTSTKDGARVEIDGKPFTELFLTGGGAMKPYLHPLRAASGTCITRMWPMAEVPGEPHDHRHQRGVFIGHEQVNGVDFWNNEESYKTPSRGRQGASGPVEIHGSAMVVPLNWTDPGGDVLIEEQRGIRFRADGDLRIVDFDTTLRAKQRVTFGDAKDGFFGLRMRPELQADKGSGHIVNADGLETEKNAWGKPSNWVDYYGKIGDEAVGVAIFDHPGNPRHPERWHVRGYGLFAVNPFGLAVFTGDKSQDGALTVEPGQTIRFRYRIVVHPGSAKITNLYESYIQEK
jgi:hypothetical protein